MRILIDYRPALRQRTGVGEYVHHLALALGQLVSQSSPSAADGRDSISLFSSSWRDRPPFFGPHVAVIDRRIPVRLLNFLWHRVGWPPAELVAGGRFDVVHSLHPLLMPARRAAQVVTVHDLDFLRHPERTRAEIRRDYPLLARQHARRADLVMVPSRHVASEVERELGVPAHRLAVCPPGAPDWPPRGPAGHGGYILFVGTIEARKNIGVLLAAYERLLAKRHSMPDLVLAGGFAPEAQQWAASACRPPLQGHIRFLGYVPDDQRYSIYSGASLVVIPSHDEGFGLPALEAMTIGVPVLASSRGALPEVVDDAGLLFDPDDEEELASTIERMLDDDALADASAARGILQAKQFSWERSAKAALEAYALAVDERRRKAGAGAARQESKVRMPGRS